MTVACFGGVEVVATEQRGEFLRGLRPLLVGTTYEDDSDSELVDRGLAACDMLREDAPILDVIVSLAEADEAMGRDEAEAFVVSGSITIWSSQTFCEEQASRVESAFTGD